MLRHDPLTRPAPSACQVSRATSRRWWRQRPHRRRGRGPQPPRLSFAVQLDTRPGPRGRDRSLLSRLGFELTPWPIPGYLRMHRYLSILQRALSRPMLRAKVDALGTGDPTSSPPPTLGAMPICGRRRGYRWCAGSTLAGCSLRTRFTPPLEKSSSPSGSVQLVGSVIGQHHPSINPRQLGLDSGKVDRLEGRASATGSMVLRIDQTLTLDGSNEARTRDRASTRWVSINCWLTFLPMLQSPLVSLGIAGGAFKTFRPRTGPLAIDSWSQAPGLHARKRSMRASRRRPKSLPSPPAPSHMLHIKLKLTANAVWTLGDVGHRDRDQLLCGLDGQRALGEYPLAECLESGGTSGASWAPSACEFFAEWGIKVHVVSSFNQIADGSIRRAARFLLAKHYFCSGSFAA